MKWTQAQQKVIDTRNKNLLVSAAAGSGKTAVLVERIISMISEGEDPIDIDHLLVVTFTNAAAAQMRERIGKALDQKLLLQPGSQHLQKQISLLQSAQITTIHSFCLNVIRNYFHCIDLDPSFKMAEESEITLIKSDVIEEVLERWYEEGREDFHEFIESYSHSKSDQPVEDLILQLYNFSMSNPWPKDWLLRMQKVYDIDTLDEMEAAQWMKDLLHYLDIVLEDLSQKNQEAIGICNESDGPAAYLPALLSDREIIIRLRKEDSYRGYCGLFSDITYARLSPKKEEGVSQAKKDLVKGLREEIKKGIKDLAGQFFFQSPEEMLKDFMSVKRVMKVLFELTIDFMEEFAKKKEEKNLIDFNDLEHFALNILVEEKNGENVPTKAAIELSEQYEEILIDEYQDSNLVQETILRSISREHLGKSNRFMVGDVKQSIYKFRLAMPELFLEKYRNYSTKDTLSNGEINDNQRIDLDQNFRSRKTVLDCVNKIFEQIMTEPVGGIAYDDAASLKYGGLFDEVSTETVNKGSEAVSLKATGSEAAGSQRTGIINASDSNEELQAKFKNRIADSAELLLVTEEDEEDINEQNEQNIGQGEESVFPSGTDLGLKPEGNASADEIEEAVYTKKELEARMIAGRIKELTDPDKGLLLYDKDKKCYRSAAYHDIVILLRSMTGWSDIFVNTLMQEGIPACADTGTGYFQTVEIMTIINMLRIIDNPRQDIPLVGILYSPMVGITATQLAKIRVCDRNKSMYTAVLAYSADGGEEELKNKLGAFLKQLEEFRRMAAYTPIHELIEKILETTGYDYFCLAMPGGDRRKANIDMLVSQAVQFEKGTYTGLFHFIRYIEKLQKYDVDYGEASASGENENTVRIMSIHKSKGLEFPIVFVSGLSKQYNTQDLRSSIVLSADYGVGPEYVDIKHRTRVSTLLKKVLQKKLLIDNLGEELRVLYVAMTRAKEKLIMTGYLDRTEDITGKDFSFFELLSSKSYLDLVLPAIVNRIGKENIIDDSCTAEENGLKLVFKKKKELISEEITKQIFLKKDEEELKSLDPQTIYDKSIRDEIKSRFNFTYPYRNEAGLRVKMTVSELKKLGQFVDEEQSENLFPESLPDTYGNEPLSMIRDDRQEQKRNIQPEQKQNKQASGSGGGIDGDIAGTEEANATIPAFIRGGEQTLTGTDRGTLYHKVLELLDFSKIDSRDEVLLQMEEMAHGNQIREADIQRLKLDHIYRFTQSGIARRMREAQESGKLFREKQFVIGIKANEVINEPGSGELVLIQGIIDVFFEEDDEIVLLDYKSDIVEDENQLVKRYKVQLIYYRKAIEQIFKKKVKEMLIYSLHLGKEIRID